MNATFVPAEKVPQPPNKIVLELTEEEAELLCRFVGACSGVEFYKKINSTILDSISKYCNRSMKVIKNYHFPMELYSSLCDALRKGSEKVDKD